MKYFIFTLLLVSTSASAGTPNKADTIHPDIHSKVGAAGGNANANPNGVNENGGQIHGIGANPGQADTNPSNDGTKGFANELDNVHGGIGDVNKNVD